MIARPTRCRRSAAALVLVACVAFLPAACKDDRDGKGSAPASSAQTEDREGKDIPGPFSLWLQRHIQGAWNWVTAQERFGFLWGAICRFAVPTPNGYVAGTGFGVSLLVPQPDGRLHVVATANIGSSTHGGASLGNRVYLAAGYDGLVTLDASRPNELRVLGRATGVGYALSVALSKGYAFLAYKEKGGLAIYKLRDPEPPLLVQHLEAGDSFAQIVVDGDRAYAVGDERVLIFDVANPEQPALLGTLAIPYQILPKPTDPMPRHIAVRGQRAFVAHGAHGLLELDVSDPKTPRVMTRIEGIDFCDWVTVNGNRLYAASEGSPVKVADISDPDSPRWVGDLDMGDAPPGAGVLDVASLQGATQLLPLALGPRGIFLYDTRENPLPKLISSYVPPAYFNRVRVIGDQAYAAAGTGGLEVYSLADPARPRLVGTHRTQGMARGLSVIDDQLWVSDVLGWVLIMKPVEGAVPELLDETDRGGHAWEVDAVGDRVFFANSQVGIGAGRRVGGKVEMEGEAFAGGYTIEVAGFGSYGYGGTVGNGVVVFRCDPPPPHLVRALHWGTIGPIRIGPVATAVTVHGSTLYVGDARGKLLAYSLADPSSPELLWSRHLGAAIFDIVAEDDGLWISAGPDGVVQLDVTGPKPREIRRLALPRGDAPATAMSSARYRDRVLVAAGAAGLVSLPLPASP